MIVAILCLPIAAVAIVAGFVDAVAGARRVDKVIGVTICLAGAALLVAALKVVNPNSFRRVRDWALVGFLVGSFPGLALCFVQVSSSSYSWRFVVCFLALLFPALGAALLLVLHARPRLMKPLLSASLIVALFGAMLPLMSGAVNAVADAAIPSLELDSTVVGHKPDGTGNTVAIVDSTFILRNIGKRRLVVVGSMYAVYSTKTVLRNLDRAEENHESLAHELMAYGWSGKYETPSAEQMIEGGLETLRPGLILEPGQHLVSHIVTPIPLASADLVRVAVTVITGFGDSVRLGAQNHRLDESLGLEGQGYSRWYLQPSGWIEWLAAGPRQLRVEYRLVKGSAADPNRALAFHFRMGPEGQLEDADYYESVNDQFDQKATTKLGLGAASSHRLLALIAPSPAR